jgi:hypothetical protein
VAYNIGPSVNPLQNKETQHVSNILQYIIDFLNNQIRKEIMLELNVKHSSVPLFSTDFSFQNLVFWNLFEFSVVEIT